MRARRHLQKGISAIIALVLIVLFGLIGIYMATQFTVSSISTTLSFNTMQAWFAARSGVEWGTVQVLNDDCDNFPGNLTVDNYNVVVTCVSADASEGSDDHTIFELVSTAQRGAEGEITHIFRRVRAVVISDD